MIRINCREHFACIDSNAMGSKESSSSSDLAPNAAVTSGFKTNSTTRETWRWICSFQHRQTQHHLWKNKSKKKKRWNRNKFKKCYVAKELWNNYLPLDEDAWTTLQCQHCQPNVWFGQKCLEKKHIFWAKIGKYLHSLIIHNQYFINPCKQISQIAIKNSIAVSVWLLTRLWPISEHWTHIVILTS